MMKQSTKIWLLTAAALVVLGLTLLGFALSRWDFDFTANYETELLNGDYSLNVQAYYKKMYHQVEYKGNMLDFIYTSYTLDNVLLKGEGKNYGLNFMLHKRTGRLTGWLGYAWGRALRRFNHLDYPST